MAQPVSGPQMAVLSADMAANIEQPGRRVAATLAGRAIAARQRHITRQVYPDAAHLTDLRGAR